MSGHHHPPLKVPPMQLARALLKLCGDAARHAAEQPVDEQGAWLALLADLEAVFRSTARPRLHGFVQRTGGEPCR